MTKSGWSQSIFGYWFFFGRPAAAREAIVQNEKLRRWLVMESYAKAIACIILGILVLVFF